MQCLYTSRMSIHPASRQCVRRDWGSEALFCSCRTCLMKEQTLNMRSTVNTCTCMFKNILNHDYLHSLAASISQTTRSLAYTNGSFEKFGFKFGVFLGLVGYSTQTREAIYISTILKQMHNF